MMMDLFTVLCTKIYGEFKSGFLELKCYKLNETFCTVSSPKCLISYSISVLRNSSESFSKFVVRIGITKELSMRLLWESKIDNRQNNDSNSNTTFLSHLFLTSKTGYHITIVKIINY